MDNIEERIKEYYSSLKRIEYLNLKYERLSANVNELIKCISNSKHTLEVLLPAQRYDVERVSTSKTGVSPQERALLQSEERMEQKIFDFKRDQEDCLLERYELEGNCEDLRMLIEELNEQEQTICELRYRENKSYEMIGNVISADRSTVRRRVLNIHKKLAEELSN